MKRIDDEFEYQVLSALLRQNRSFFWIEGQEAKRPQE